MPKSEGGTISSNINSNSSVKLGTFLMILALIASAMMMLFVLQAETDESSAKLINSGQCGPNATYNLYSSGMLEITGSGEMFSYDATPAPWYECRDNINSVYISEKITKLGASAFKDCNHLTYLIIPITLNSVISDKCPAFAGCCSIERINFTVGNGGYGYDYTDHEGNDSWYQNTPWYQSRDSLKGINFSDEVKKIGHNALRELNISSIALPDSVVNLGNHCFYNCTKLTDLTIPVSLNPYGSNDKYPAFQGCMAIQKVTFTKGNDVPFDFWNFWHGKYNTNLAPWNMNSDVAKTIVIADDITKLGEYMFSGCNIKELTIPVNIDLYGGCTAHAPFKEDDEESYANLEKVTITKGSGSGCDYNVNTSSRCPWNSSKWSSYLSSSKTMTVIVEEGVTHIGSFTFHYCNIENLTLPNSLTSFGSNAFTSCKIKNLTIPISLNATWLDKKLTFFNTAFPAFQCVSGIEKIDFTPGSGYGFDYDANTGNNCWYQHTPWYHCRDSLKEINFAEGITHIGSNAFRELNITSLVIPNSVESLGCHAFYNMKKLSSLTIPISLDCVASTEYPAFDQDYNITKVRYTAGTNGIGHDYTDSVPFWNYPTYSGFTVIFDSNIKYIGTNTLSAYFFTDKEGNQLEPTAANLSGYIFWATLTPCMHLICESTTFGEGI